MTRLLADSVKESAAKVFGSIAARMIGSGCIWSSEDQKVVSDRCITAAIVFDAAWQARRRIHDDDIGAEDHPRPSAVAARRRS